MTEAKTKDERETRAEEATSRGSFYVGLGISLLAGLLAVAGLGMLGITSLGLLSQSTAMAMIGLSIGVVALVSFITLVSMRRTLTLLNDHEAVLNEQAERQAALDARSQAEWKAAQAQRDRDQDAVVAELSRRQDSSEVKSAVEAEMNRADRIRTLAQFHSNGDGAEGDPFKGGDIHPVQDVEGIAEYFGPLLDEMNISDTETLWHAKTGDIATALDVSPSVVDQWKCQSELMAIDGIGKQYAELIVRSGVGSIRELSAQDPQRFLSRIDRLQARLGLRVQGNTIGTKAVESWIAAAGSHPNSAPSTKGKETKAKEKNASASSGSR